jgi:phosphate transport system substrate-binding protein
MKQTVYALILLFLLNACVSGGHKIRIDGSSTVYPITEAVVEEFVKKNRNTKITVGHAGTGGGLKKFCRNEIDITNASRNIKKKEIEACKGNGIDFLELSVALDGLAIVVHPSNDWAKDITVAELKKMWEPAAQDKIKYWDQIRPTWPHKPLNLYGAGVSSGTYDYFTEAIMGESHASRGDYNASEDDNVLVSGIAGDPYALGFFGVAYYEENRDKLKLVPVDDENPNNGNGPILPTVENVKSGQYAPLSRPLFIYVNKLSARRTDIQEFIHFYLENVADYTREVGYIPMSKEDYQKEMAKFQDFIKP